MAVRITNMLLTSPVSLPNPVDDNLRPRQSKTYQYVEYDKLVNDPRIADYLRKKIIRIDNLDATLINYVSQWNLEPKLRMTPYVFWIDATGMYRMKFGDPTFDFDGIVVGPMGAHGSTHVFDGSDPVPRIEVLEGSWTCTVGENLLDVVYEAGSSFVQKANATATATMPAIGFIIIKPTGTTCTIARSGEVDGFVGLTPGATYFVSAVSGQITSTPPSGSGNVVQRVGYAKTNTILMVQLGEPAKRA